MNWKKIIAIGLTGCFLFSGCAEQRQNAQKMGEEGTQEDSYESTTFAMDTVMTFHIVAPDGEDLLIDAEQEVKRLEKLFSVTDEDSDIEQINDNAGDKAVTVSADTLALLKAGNCHNPYLDTVENGSTLGKFDTHDPQLDAKAPKPTPKNQKIDPLVKSPKRPALPGAVSRVWGGSPTHSL